MGSGTSRLYRNMLEKLEKMEEKLQFFCFRFQLLLLLYQSPCGGFGNIVTLVIQEITAAPLAPVYTV